MKSTTLIATLLALFIACGASFGAGYFVAKSEEANAPETLASVDGEDDDAGAEQDPELLEIEEPNNDKAHKEEETPKDPTVTPKPEGESVNKPTPPTEGESIPAVDTDTPRTNAAPVTPEEKKKAEEKAALDKAREKLKELEGELEGLGGIDPESIFGGPKVDFEATVSGSVVDGNGIPVAGAKVYADYSEAYDSGDGNRRVSFVMAGGDKGSVIATTDGSGLWQATISRKVSEKAALRAGFTGDAEGYAESEKSSFTLKNGEERTGIKLVLRGAGVVTGRVVDGMGRGVAGVTVGLNKAGGNGYGLDFNMGGSKHSAETDAAGEFRIEGVPEGRYKFKLSGTGVRQISGPTEIDVESGREMRAAADFQVAGTSSVRVAFETAEGGKVRGWATLKFKDDQGKVVKQLSGRIEDGIFEANDPPIGSFDVEASVWGFEPQTVRATLLENQPCDLGTLIMQESTGEEGGITIFPEDE